MIGNRLCVERLDLLVAGHRGHFVGEHLLGFRGAARYIADSFRECFRMEAAALKKVRDEMGLTNIEIMVPFVRTLKEADDKVKNPPPRPFPWFWVAIGVTLLSGAAFGLQFFLGWQKNRYRILPSEVIRLLE